ncbi:MAG: hypothetical protein IKW99_03105 [Bacteroidales bacterium]|nr:hypothetical protein [Bacteroidales bacterium]
MCGFERFILENEEVGTSRLLLSRVDWPSPPDDSLISFFEGKELAVNTIEARLKLRNKVPEWYSIPSLVYPSALCAEQCSSSVTAGYKASLSGRILEGVPGRIADLTGGLGVDSWAFSSVASEVLYNERDPRLVAAVKYNLPELGVSNVRFSNQIVTHDSVGAVLGSFNPDIIFLDPARRSSEGNKVFLLEDCSPDVLSLLPSLLAHSRHVLLKLSPMADISMVVERIDRAYEKHLESVSGSGWNGNWVREIHVVACGGECKELLVWIDRDWKGDYSVICREDGGALAFELEEIRSSKPSLPESANFKFVFEPGKSLLKAGVLNALCERSGLVKLARFTQLLSFRDFISRDEALERLGALAGMGKLFEVEEVMKMGKAAFKDVRKRFPRSEVSARNIPMSSDELRSRLGVKSGDDAHVFGVKVETPFESANFLLVCHRI